MPLRLTVGKRSLESGAAEAQVRRGRVDHEGGVPLQGAAEAVRELWAVSRRAAGALTFGRLSGVDRSGPPPPETLPGAPLNLWTIPNAIGMVRLGLLPVLLIASSSSDSGTGPLPAVLFAVAGWADYFDGIAARVTGQYSRSATLLDPIVDRLLVLSGVIVCWYHELLPRWALASSSPASSSCSWPGARRCAAGIEIRVNMVGRLAIWPVLSALEFAFCGLETLSTVLFYIGLAMTLVATVMYVLAARPSTSA